jgi:hypothetical protein
VPKGGCGLIAIRDFNTFEKLQPSSAMHRR